MSTSAADFGSVTATVTSDATEATGVPCLGRNETAFLSNVLAWPGNPTDAGYVNLHYSMPDLKKEIGRASCRERVCHNV